MLDLELAFSWEISSYLFISIKVYKHLTEKLSQLLLNIYKGRKFILLPVEEVFGEVFIIRANSFQKVLKIDKILVFLAKRANDKLWDFFFTHFKPLIFHEVEEILRSETSWTEVKVLGESSRGYEVSIVHQFYSTVLNFIIKDNLFLKVINSNINQLLIRDVKSFELFSCRKIYPVSERLNRFSCWHEMVFLFTINLL